MRISFTECIFKCKKCLDLVLFQKMFCSHVFTQVILLREKEITLLKKCHCLKDRPKVCRNRRYSDHWHPWCSSVIEVEGGYSYFRGQFRVPRLNSTFWPGCSKSCGVHLGAKWSWESEFSLGLWFDCIKKTTPLWSHLKPKMKKLDLILKPLLHCS